jgi:hypothetical protein
MRDISWSFPPTVCLLLVGCGSPDEVASRASGRGSEPCRDED